MYQALYRSFRPETFNELLGQEHIQKILRSQIESGTVGHAYVFCGTRGTGKTTTARLLAKALNCTAEKDRPCGVCENCRAIAAGEFIDVQEIDAASFTGVDNIRDLREQVNYPPAVGRNKVYIIDEAHMLTNAAFNALLKTLEEPPANTTFILATTEPGKLPATILSRCMRLDFKRVSEEVISELFRRICIETGVDADEDALSLIASNADGSVRDGLSILDRCIAGNKRLKRDDVLFLLGLTDADTFLRITEKVFAGKTAEALSVFSEVLSEGKESVRFALDWTEHFRNLMLVKFADNPENVINLSRENIEKLKKQSAAVPMSEIDRCIRILSKAVSEARWSPKPRVLAELAVVEMCGKQSGEEAERLEPFRARSEARPAADSAKPKDAAEAPKPRDVREALKPRDAAEMPKLRGSFEAPKPQVSEESAPSAFDEAGENLENTWYNVMHSDKVSPILRMSQSSLRGMGQGKFTVQLSNDIIKNSFEAERELIESLMQEETGKKLRMETVVKDLRQGK